MTAAGCPKNANVTDLAMGDNSSREHEKYWLRFVHCSPFIEEKQTNKQISQRFDCTEVILLPFRQTVLAMQTRGLMDVLLH